MELTNHAINSEFSDFQALNMESPLAGFITSPLEKEILNFSEGLRVVGVVPDEKLALFADNSCRWLIADQDALDVVSSVLELHVTSMTEFWTKTNPFKLLNLGQMSYYKHLVAQNERVLNVSLVLEFRMTSRFMAEFWIKTWPKSSAPAPSLPLMNVLAYIVLDAGIMATGAINVVRGTRSSSEELLNIYNHSESNALVVDSPQFFNRLAESLIPKADVRFIVLLWGDKLSLNKELVKGIPLYDYNDIIELGSKSRHTLLHSSKPEPGVCLFLLKSRRQHLPDKVASSSSASLAYHCYYGLILILIEHGPARFRSPEKSLFICLFRNSLYYL
ncbi:hypothetical protein ZIOFF_063601 [Zingiber officinale]|uniref:Uncharacterized protein n=1 Tax=Zingiber officinale TaxID=94328 RepID=A0A8J5F2E1_ZINOF|nr:hypothetical protein ZIOFF_063601 [Zingiber officinale]